MKINNRMYHQVKIENPHFSQTNHNQVDQVSTFGLGVLMFKTTFNNISVISWWSYYILGHLKKMFWFSDNGFKKKGKVGRVFIFCFYFQSNMGRVFIFCFYFQRFKNITQTSSILLFWQTNNTIVFTRRVIFIYQYHVYHVWYILIKTTTVYHYWHIIIKTLPVWNVTVH